jgi:hypothetical protein
MKAGCESYERGKRPAQTRSRVTVMWSLAPRRHVWRLPARATRTVAAPAATRERAYLVRRRTHCVEDRARGRQDAPGHLVHLGKDLSEVVELAGVAGRAPARGRGQFHFEQSVEGAALIHLASARCAVARRLRAAAPGGSVGLRRLATRQRQDVLDPRRPPEGRAYRSCQRTYQER